MSIRCQIGIYNNINDKNEDFEALIYRHSDGYPGCFKKDGSSEYGVVTEILPWLKWFMEERGWDEEYLPARLLQFMCNEDDKRMGEKQGVLSYGISKDFHGDIEYFYKISPHKLEVYKIYGEKFSILQHTYDF